MSKTGKVLKSLMFIIIFKMQNFVENGFLKNLSFCEISGIIKVQCLVKGGVCMKNNNDKVINLELKGKKDARRIAVIKRKEMERRKEIKKIKIFGRKRLVINR